MLFMISSSILSFLSCAPSKQVVTCGPGTYEENGQCVSEQPSSAAQNQNNNDGTNSDTGQTDVETTVEDCFDGLDNDLDGVVDCDDLDCLGVETCDFDNDGFTPADGDCDDANAKFHPNGVDGLLADRNCDGVAANGNITLAEYVFLGENPEDYAGYWVSSAGDVDGDGLDDVVVGAYDNDSNGESSGAAYLLLGKSLTASGVFDISQADYKFVGEEAGDWAGFVVDAADVDGDGLDDILLGAYGVDDRGPITGAAYLVLGSSLGGERTINLEQADYKFLGEAADDYAGYNLSFAGDVDGDGLEDILIGASGHDSNGVNAGAGYLIFAASLGSSTSIELSDADYKFVGETEFDWAGYQIANAGDVDGDGLGDILIGADGDEGGAEAHASYLILGASLGSNTTIHLAEADHKFIGEQEYDYASQVSTAGDVDGDGLDDILIGAAGSDTGGDGAGAAYVVLGRSLGGARVFDLSFADYKFIGENAQDNVGSTVANAGDIDGDGLDDIVLGAIYYHSQFAYQGAAYVVLGKSLGTESSMSLNNADYRLVGREKDYVGAAVAGAGDIDGDGRDDIVLGAYGGPDWNGAVFVITGG